MIESTASADKTGDKLNECIIFYVCEKGEACLRGISSVSNPCFTAKINLWKLIFEINTNYIVKILPFANKSCSTIENSIYPKLHKVL